MYIERIWFAQLPPSQYIFPIASTLSILTALEKVANETAGAYVNVEVSSEEADDTIPATATAINNITTTFGVNDIVSIYQTAVDRSKSAR